MKAIDFLIIGAGFAGSVCARSLAEAGYSVVVADKREHIGGNAFDSTDAHGVLVHNYGPHIFHTNSEKIVRWLSQFTEWRFYEHKVLACVEEKLYPIPINKTTINSLYGLNLDEKGVAEFLESKRIPKESIRTSEDVVLNSVGSDLCDKFFRGYTKKQWGLDLSELSAGVAARIPTRTNDDDRYFTDTYQLMPARGYTEMFKNMLNHKNIEVMTATSFDEIKPSLDYKKLIFTGPIDEYYDFKFGKLPYRSLRFEHKHLTERDSIQTVGTVNYPNNHEYTRITEFKHLTGQSTSGTSVVEEYPSAEGDPYYPIPKKENEDLYRKYRELADHEVNVHFVGRLAQYKYYNMDQVVASALKLAEELQNAA